MKSASASRTRILLAVLSFVVIASGCQFLRNFTTYFNILYLAQQHIDLYEEQMHMQSAPSTNAAQAVLSHRWLDEEYEMRQYALHKGGNTRIDASFLRAKLPQRGAGSSVHLDSAIILGSKILANHKNTKYVEDALYIVGKAQFYKNDYAGAKRKFIELLTLFPQTKYGSSVQMFLARSMLASNVYDSAQIALARAVKEAESEHDQVTLGDAHRTLAEIIFARTPDSLTAIASELEAAEKYYQPEEASRVAYEAGAVEYLNGDWSKAEASFQRAITGAKDANFEAEARIAHALALRQEQKFVDAKAELQLVSEREKFSMEWPPAKYELAYTVDLEARAAVGNDLKSPLFVGDKYPTVKRAYYIVDTTYQRVSQVIVSRSKFRQAELLRGMGDYDSASRYALPLIGTHDFSTSQMNDYVSERMRSLAKFASWRNDLNRLDSLDRDLRMARQGVSLTAVKEAEIHSDAVRNVLGPRYRPDVRPTLTKADSSAIVKEEFKLRKAKGILGAFDRLGVHDTVRFADSVHFMMARDHYEIAQDYEHFQEVDDARGEYKTALSYRYVTQDSGRDEFRAQVLFTWLQLEAGEKNIVRRDSLMNELVTYYNQSIFTRQAVILYGGPRDLNSPGELAYRTAYGTLRQSGLDAGKNGLLAVASGFRLEDVAPRSLYAIGVSFEETQKFDSAVVYYKRVLTEYPYSAYADALRPRLAEAGIVRSQTQTARRIEAPEIKSDAEKEREEIERVRKQRQQEMYEEMQRNRLNQPKLPGQDTVTSAPSQGAPLLNPGSPFQHESGQGTQDPAPVPPPMIQPAKH